MHRKTEAGWWWQRWQGRRLVAQWAKQWHAQQAPRPDRFQPASQWHLAPLARPVLSKTEQAHLQRWADDLLHHRWHIAGQERLEPAINWSADPFSGDSAPADFAWSESLRPEAVARCQRVVRKKNQHHHLSQLAAAAFLLNDPACAAEWWRQWQGWHSAHPWMTGLAWRYDEDIGQRLLAWCMSEVLLRGSPTYQQIFSEHSPFWIQLWWHCDVARQRFHQLDGYQRIATLAGCSAACMLFPVYRSTVSWRSWAQRSLLAACQQIIAPDGLSLEQCWGSQGYILECLVTVAFIAEQTKHPLDPGIKNCIRIMAEAVACLHQRLGTVPIIGDSRDFRAVVLGPEDDVRIDWLLSAAARMVGAQVGLQRRSMHGLCMQVEAIRAPTAAKAAQPFFASKWWLGQFENQDGVELSVLCDAGTLGWQGARHAHADALSLCMNCDGIPVCIDPGASVVSEGSVWQAWFRGTTAHNTLCVDDHDQVPFSQVGGWKHALPVQIKSWEEHSLIAEHAGYKKRGLRHQRRVHMGTDGIQVEDFLIGRGRHVSALHWHIDARWQVFPRSDGIDMVYGDHRVRLRWNGDGHATVWCGGQCVHGEQDSHDTMAAAFLGWFMPQEGQRAACTTYRIVAVHNGDLMWRTVFDVQRSGQSSRLLRVPLPITAQASVID